MTYSEFITNIRPTFEILFFLSGTIIVFAAFYALKQIGLSKKSITIQSKRDSMRLTAEQCADYMERIIPLQNMIDEEIKNLGINYYKDWQIKINEDSVEVERNSPPDFTNLEKLFASRMFNPMEAFCTYFTSSVADELIAYNTVGTTFISTVDKFYTSAA